MSSLRPVAQPSAATFAQLLGSWRAGSGPAYRRLAEAIRRGVLDGRIVAGTRLPAEREAAAALDVSRTTVASAYTALREDGWLVSRQGSGSVVRMASTPVPQPLGLPGAVAPDDLELIDLTTASLPAPEPAFSASVSAALADLPRWSAGPGYHPLGLPELRAAIADYYTAADLPTTPEQVLVTNGAQHGLSLCLGELTARLDRVLIESPTYPAALDVVRRSNRTPMPIGVLPQAADPWPVDVLDSAFRQTASSAAYLIPDFHNPTGHVMSTDVRERVLALAGRRATTVVVDESFRELHLDPGPLPPRMASFDTDGRAITVGSLSKPVWGGLRIGWLRAPSSVIERLAMARSLADMAGPVIEQLIAVHVLASLDAHVAIQRQRLRDARTAVVAALREHAPDWSFAPPTGGAMLWVRLPEAVAGEAARIAPEYGVRLVPGTRFGPDGAMDNFLRIPLTRAPELLAAGVPRAVAAVNAARAGQRSGSPAAPALVP